MKEKIDKERISFSIVGYLTLVDQNSDKDYLIVRDDITGIFYTTWGVIGKSSLRVDTKRADISDIESLIRAKIRKGYKLILNSKDHISELHNKKATLRLMRVITEVYGTSYYNHYNSKITNKLKAVVIPGYIKNMKKYLEVNPNDSKIMVIAMKMGKCKDIAEADLFMVKNKIHIYFEENDFIDRVILILNMIKSGNDPIFNYLNSLDKEKTKCLNENEVSLLRSVFLDKNYTIARLHWMKNIFEKIDEHSSRLNLKSMTSSPLTLRLKV